MKDRIDNKVKAWYMSLKKDGYYLRPCKYNNGYIVTMTKDLNPVGHNCTAYRRTSFEVNMPTAKRIAALFGFKIAPITKYFGKCEPIKTGYKRITEYK